MKVTPIELQQIIKEEALRLKKIMMLESEKASIIKQLKEMESCEEETLEEVWPFKKADPAVEKQKYVDLINKHPAYSKTSAFVAKQNNLDVNMVFEKLVEFVMANGGFPTGGLAWDNAKQAFVDKTVYKGTAPGMQGAAE